MSMRSTRAQPGSRANPPWWGWLIIGVIAVVGLLASPWNVGGLTSKPQPVANYEAAAQRIEELQADRQSLMNPECLPQFMAHGHRVAKVIVFVHGYTSCPQQFHALGQEFYETGYNVLIAPLPHHGLADRLTNEQSRLTAEELAEYGDRVVDIAQGLGDQVVLAGISGGGVVTAWAAQNRRDVDLAVIISPAFGFKQIPTPLTSTVMNVLSVMPESYSWWDPTLQADVAPSYAYPRYSRWGLVQIMRLGFSVQQAVRAQAPSAGRILVVLNGNDQSVNNVLTRQVLSAWQQDGAAIETYEFPASLGLPHDLIDPSQPGQNTGVVYPKLFSLIRQ